MKSNQQKTFSLLALVFLCVPAAAQTTTENPSISHCTVSAKLDLRIPAQDAGVLKVMLVEEGDTIKAGDPLGKLADTEAVVQKKVAENALARAKEQAASEIEINFSTKAAGVSKAVYDAALAANAAVFARGGKNPPYPETETRRLRLDWERAGFQIERAQMEKRMAEMEYEARVAELDGANAAVERRRFFAPFDGKIIQLYRHKGDWVQPGDPILRLMSFKTMTIKGDVDAGKYTPAQLQNKLVTIEVKLAQGRVVQLQGKVTNVIPIIHGGNTYGVEAEVENKQENGHWLVPHGIMAKMTIHLN